MNAAGTASAVHSQGQVAARDPLTELSDHERLIIEIFELDPYTFSPSEPPPTNTSDGKALPQSATVSIPERIRTSEPGSLDRDFWEQVAVYEKELAQSGNPFAPARVHSAIALAAGALSSNSPAMPSHPLSAANAFTAESGSSSLVDRHDQLTQRAAVALAFAHTLPGSALRAASSTKT